MFLWNLTPRCITPRRDGLCGESLFAGTQTPRCILLWNQTRRCIPPRRDGPFGESHVAGTQRAFPSCWVRLRGVSYCGINLRDVSLPAESTPLCIPSQRESAYSLLVGSASMVYPLLGVVLCGVFFPQSRPARCIPSCDAPLRGVSLSRSRIHIKKVQQSGYRIQQ